MSDGEYYMNYKVEGSVKGCWFRLDGWGFSFSEMVKDTFLRR